MPLRIAYTAICVRAQTSSFAKIFATWFLMVLSETSRREAICFYSLTAYAADESGNTIYQQTDPGNNNRVVPFDNGPYAIVETDGNNIVSLGGHLGPYSAPGNDDPNGPYAEAFTVKCNSVGTATVVMHMLRSGTSTGSVNGYTYSAANYPQAGSILSVVGADEYFGNVLTLDCTASGSLIIE